MRLIVGTILVFVCVFGSYAMMGGHLEVLWQPFEFVIILGAAIGAFIIGNPGPVLKAVPSMLGTLVKGPKYKQDCYVELLAMQFSLYKLAKQKGMTAIEPHVENPGESTLFNAFPTFAANHHAVEFVCDYMRMVTMGADNVHEIDALMDEELETHHQEQERIVAAMQSLADGTPALGIVAAVLGVIKTMGAISEPPEVLGHLIGGALVGTFFGVFVAYGFFAPMAASLKSTFEAESKYYISLKAGLLAHISGQPPVMSVEFARKALFSEVRPTYSEVEAATAALPAAASPHSPAGSPMAKSTQPIIIKKVKKAAHAHHGGAWKIAYADFVTAMMAFFLLMWLISMTTQEQKTGLANYFAPPNVSPTTSGSGGILMGTTIDKTGAKASDARDAPGAGTGRAGDREGGGLAASDSDAKRPAANAKANQSAAASIRQALQAMPEYAEMSRNIVVEATREGVNVSLTDQDGRSMFPDGSVRPYERTRLVLEALTPTLRRLNNRLSVTGHTAATRPGSQGAESWGLTAGRAVSVREILSGAGFPSNRFTSVAGRADTEPVFPDNPYLASNQRLTITLINEAPPMPPGVLR